MSLLALLSRSFRQPVDEKIARQARYWQVEGARDGLAGRRHVEVADAERGERIHDGVEDGGQRADRAGLAGALRAQVIEKVRRLFNAKTDTEAIQRALQKAVEDREIEGALDRLLKGGRFRTVYR